MPLEDRDKTRVTAREYMQGNAEVIEWYMRGGRDLQVLGDYTMDHLELAAAHHITMSAHDLIRAGAPHEDIAHDTARGYGAAASLTEHISNPRPPRGVLSRDRYEEAMAQFRKNEERKHRLRQTWKTTAGYAAEKAVPHTLNHGLPRMDYELMEDDLFTPDGQLIDNPALLESRLALWYARTVDASQNGVRNVNLAEMFGMATMALDRRDGEMTQEWQELRVFTASLADRYNELIKQ